MNVEELLSIVPIPRYGSSKEETSEIVIHLWKNSDTWRLAKEKSEFSVTKGESLELNCWARVNYLYDHRMPC